MHLNVYVRYIDVKGIMSGDGQKPQDAVPSAGAERSISVSIISSISIRLLVTLIMYILIR